MLHNHEESIDFCRDFLFSRRACVPTAREVGYEGVRRGTVDAASASGDVAREDSAPQRAGSKASYCPAESGFAPATGSAGNEFLR